MQLIVKLILYAGLIFIVPFIVPGVTIDTFWPTAVIGGLVFYIVSNTIKPIINILTLPITLITLGLFSVVINAAMFWVSSRFVVGFTVSTISAAIAGGIVAAIGTWLISLVFAD